MVNRPGRCQVSTQSAAGVERLRAAALYLAVAALQWLPAPLASPAAADALVPAGV